MTAGSALDMKEERNTRPFRAAVATLGCKVNQFESDVIRGAIREAGFEEISLGTLPADVVIINTCSVTGKADAESRRLIRLARRENPDARVVVTGCYATRAESEVKALGENVTVVSNALKNTLVENIRGLGKDHAGGPNGSAGGDWGSGIYVTGRSRALLKIQDGCDGVCTYCVVPRVRGKSVSLALERVVEAAGHASDAGFRELVLTGIHIGHYGKDLSNNVTLEVCIRNILKYNTNIHVRISSIEIGELSDGLLDLVAEHPRVCRHLHLPLQSGSDRILAKMRRGYRQRAFVDVLERVKERNAEICVGTDVIVGFPGETDAEYAETAAVLESSGIDYVHAFSFSPRSGTPAAGFPERVPAIVRRERTRAVRDISRENQERFARSLRGKSARAIIEGRGPNGSLTALSDNYQKVSIINDREAVPKSNVAIRFCDRGYGEILSQ